LKKEAGGVVCKETRRRRSWSMAREIKLEFHFLSYLTGFPVRTFLKVGKNFATWEGKMRHPW